MESLLKQTRSRFTSTRRENKEETDRTIPAQKTQSSREKKRSQSWIRRQVSRQMSWDYDFSSADYPTAVAAAAFAIQSLEESEAQDHKETRSLEESEAQDHKETSYARNKSLSKTKSKAEKEAEINPPEPLKSALKVSDAKSKKISKDGDTKVPIRTTTSKKMPERRVSFADDDETTSNKPELPELKKSPERVSSMGRTPTFVNTKDLVISEDKRPETTMPKTYHPKAVQATTNPDEAIRKGITKSRPEDSMADAWEKEEMASIDEKYQKLRATIDNWETKKKKKAKRKIERIEAELDKRRVKAVKSYHNEITRIQEIASGARAQAEENRRKEEMKVKDKSNKIRSTGKMPASCLCF